MHGAGSKIKSQETAGRLHGLSFVNVCPIGIDTSRSAAQHGAPSMNDSELAYYINAICSVHDDTTAPPLDFHRAELPMGTYFTYYDALMSHRNGTVFDGVYLTTEDASHPPRPLFKYPPLTSGLKRRYCCACQCEAWQDSHI